MKNQTKVIAIVMASLGIAGVLGVGVALAQQGSGTTLAERIASQFNLNKDDVQKVIDQDRSDHRAEREKQYEERLQKAVDEGKLTSEQRDKILAKHKELETDREAQRDTMQGKTEQERRDAMKTKLDELKQWEKDNNIPSGYLMPHDGPGGHGKGRGMGHGRGMMGDGPQGQQPSGAQTN